MDFPKGDTTEPRRALTATAFPDSTDDPTRSLAESSRRAATRERGRLTRELDDLVGLRLCSLAAHGRAAARAARDLDEHSPADLDVSLRAVLDLTETALADLREFVSGLHADAEPPGRS